MRSNWYSKHPPSCKCAMCVDFSRKRAKRLERKQNRRNRSSQEQGHPDGCECKSCDTLGRLFSGEAVDLSNL